jgi:hypothetical protein
MGKWKSTENHWAYKSRAERQEVLKRVSKGWGKKPKTGKILFCPICGRKFYLKPSYIKRAKINFCSKKCFNQSKKGNIPKNFEIFRAKSPFQRGEGNLNWHGGISLYPKEWKFSLRHKVWIRDKNTCQICGESRRSKLIVHHIDFDKKNCSMDNLQLLCRSCHMKIHNQANKKKKTLLRTS